MINFSINSHKPLRDLVYDELKQLILTGEMKPGTRLMEVDLADEMGVSRTPVREALRKLEKDKLIFIEPRKGVYVSDISVSDMMDVIEIRETLESLAASLAAGKIEESDLKDLLEARRAYEKAVLEDDKAGLIESDTLFHKIIVEASGNSYLIGICNNIGELVQRFRSKYFHEFDRAEVVTAEHERIYKAISERDPEAAKKAAAYHASSLHEALLIYQDELTEQAK